MAGVGYSQAVIARHIGISEPTLRAHYRSVIDSGL
jgi:DNA-binding CsgD family transcriptional regulator